ncbi:hypothetical protein AAGV28_09035 [Flavobacterium sp. FZUC8N2.13]|uniref:Uncharacterized protein n=1 Tax=Flavobacterium zubiriense TaxID=3138075 RepID=A0ABV4TDT4_9FLAO
MNSNTPNKAKAFIFFSLQFSMITATNTPDVIESSLPNATILRLWIPVAKR